MGSKGSGAARSLILRNDELITDRQAVAVLRQRIDVVANQAFSEMFRAEREI